VNGTTQQKVQSRKYISLKYQTLKLKTNVTSNFTTTVTGHGNIKTYLYRFKVKESPMCSCKRGEQTMDHVLFNCELVEKE